MHDHPSAIRSGLRRWARALAIGGACAVALAAAVALPRPADAATGTQKMFRLYNPYTYEHLITSNVNEKVQNTVSGWNYEGIAWNAPTTGGNVYRLRNVYTNEHLYTSDQHEYDSLNGHGWEGEGVVSHSADKDGYPIYRLYNRWAPAVAAHLYTKDANEVSVLEGQGYTNEGAKWYASRDAGDQDLYLGTFFVERSSAPQDFETVLCASRDGVNFRQISTPFGTGATQNPFHDPSIMYKDGYFYVLSNWNRQDGKFWPMVSYSKDLVTWTQPEGSQNINGGAYQGVSLESAPFGIADFDVVAPEWFVDSNGDVYIVFAAGRYGAFHGEPENDQMKLYAVKVNRISNGGMDGWPSNSGKPYPANLTLDFGSAFEIRGLDDSTNYIDASVYKDGGTYYLLAKKDGIDNQVYANSRMAADGWHRVNDSIAVGNEGPSLTKADGAYLLYTDQIATYHNGRTGIQVSMAAGPDQTFSTPKDIACAGASGTLRHGTVIQLSGDAKAAGENLVAGKL